MSGELVGTSTREVLARKLVAGDVLADGSVITEVRTSKGKRTMSTIRDEYGRRVGRSGWPIEADVVRVELEDGALRRFWPRQKVQVRDVG